MDTEQRLRRRWRVQAALMWSGVLAVWVVGLALPDNQESMAQSIWDITSNYLEYIKFLHEFGGMPLAGLITSLLLSFWTFPLVAILGLCTWRLHWCTVPITLLYLSLWAYWLFGNKSPDSSASMWVMTIAALLAVVGSATMEFKRRKLLCELAELDIDDA